MLMVIHVAEDGGHDDDGDARVAAFSICRPLPLPEALENAIAAFLYLPAQMNNMIECAI